ncbi:unnamed protein product [Protopolystoma xenopodis]|uniref:Uncharacterized protein n=1 Tax=Protopolystoma xenopodis TaxID=117903 RepID=A0A3S5A7U3_9PLAT|nr:unnamed protein product [Protopolystoma xenopodis]
MLLLLVLSLSLDFVQFADRQFSLSVQRIGHTLEASIVAQRELDRRRPSVGNTRTQRDRLLGLAGGLVWPGMNKNVPLVSAEPAHGGTAKREIRAIACVLAAGACPHCGVQASRATARGLRGQGPPVRGLSLSAVWLSGAACSTALPRHGPALLSPGPGRTTRDGAHRSRARLASRHARGGQHWPGSPSSFFVSRPTGLRGPEAWLAGWPDGLSLIYPSFRGCLGLYRQASRSRLPVPSDQTGHQRDSAARLAPCASCLALISLCLSLRLLGPAELAVLCHLASSVYRSYRMPRSVSLRISRLAVSSSSLA